MIRYRTTQNIEVPFTISPMVKEISKTRLEIKCAVKSNYSKEQQGAKIRVKIPVPKNTAICKVRCQVGKAKYYPEEGQIIWKYFFFCS